MNLPVKVLEELKCDYCQGHLSYPPIFLTEDDKNLCGRCPQPTGKLSRNFLYERLARTVSFPCPVQTCLKTCSIQEMKAHEDLIHGIVCPILPKGGCEWSGTVSHVYQHFVKEHREFVVENPFVGKPKDEPFENCLLMKAFGFLFAINIDCNEMKLRYCCRLLDDSELRGLFEGTLTLRGTVGRIRKVRKVGAIGEMFEKGLVIENNLKNVFAAVGGKYDDLQVDFEVKMKKERCEECNAILVEAPVHFQDGVYFCGICGRNQKYDDSESDDSICDLLSLFQKTLLNISNRTNNSEPIASSSTETITNPVTWSRHATSALSCKFSDCTFRTNDIIDKNRHETWLCKRSTAKCNWGCSETLQNTNLFDHYTSKHCVFFRFIKNTTALSIWSKRAVGAFEWHTGYIRIDKTVFLYRFRIDRFGLKISIMSNLPTEALLYYKLEIGLSEYRSNSEIVGRLKLNNWQDQGITFDYHLNLRKNFNCCITENYLSECFVSIKINKIRYGCLHNINQRLVCRSTRNGFFCKFFDRGCTYTSSKKNNVTKHERWFCIKGVINCKWGCLMSCDEGVSLYSHYLDYCEVTTIKNGTTIVLTNLQTKIWHKFVVKINRLKVMVRLRLTESSLDIFMITNLPAELVENYRWAFGLLHLDTNLFLKEILRTNTWESSRHSSDYYYVQNSHTYFPFLKDFSETMYKLYDIFFTVTPLCEICKNDHLEHTSVE